MAVNQPWLFYINIAIKYLQYYKLLIKSLILHAYKHPKNLFLCQYFLFFLFFCFRKLIYNSFVRNLRKLKYFVIYIIKFLKNTHTPILNPNFEWEPLVQSRGSLFFWNQHTSIPNYAIFYTICRKWTSFSPIRSTICITYMYYVFNNNLIRPNQW